MSTNLTPDPIRQVWAVTVSLDGGEGLASDSTTRRPLVTTDPAEAAGYRTLVATHEARPDGSGAAPVLSVARFVRVVDDPSRRGE